MSWSSVDGRRGTTDRNVARVAEHSQPQTGAPVALARTDADRVRVRIGNLTMTNHPLHLHGPPFEVTGTDGGWVPKSARWPEVGADIGVGQVRAIEFAPPNRAAHSH